MRLLELVYETYKKAISQNIEAEKFDFSITKEEINMILEQIKDKKTAKKEKKHFVFYKDVEKEKKEIQEGDVYEYMTENLPIIFVILEKKNNLFIGLVMTPFWELASDKALITEFKHILSDKFAVLPIALNLEPDFIKKQTFFVGKLNPKDFDILKNFYKGKIKELPEEKRGLSYPKGKNYYQELFLKDEINRTMFLQAF